MVYKGKTNCQSHVLSFTSSLAAWSQFIQLFRQRLSHKSVKAYATMPISIMGNKSLALLDEVQGDSARQKEKF